jgi:hypothetical protein
MSRTGYFAVVIIGLMATISAAYCGDSNDWNRTPQLLARGNFRAEDGAVINPLPRESLIQFLDDQFVLFVEPGLLKVPGETGFYSLHECTIQPSLLTELLKIGVSEVRKVQVGGDKTPESSDDKDSEVYNFRYGSALPLPDIASVLVNVHGVLLFEPVYVLSLADDDQNYFKSDPEFVNQWSLKDDFEGIGCETAWTIETGDPAVRIGVIEKGIDCAHPDLVNDFNSNIVVDGVTYWFDTTDSTYTVDYSWPNCADDGHGNPIAGIIAGVRDNDYCIAGIAGGDGTDASGCRIVSVRLATGAIGLRRVAYSPVLAEAITYASASLPSGLGCSILNNSYNFLWYSEVIRKSVLVAYNYGCSFVATKNNTHYAPAAIRVYPADYDYSWVTCVGGYAQDDGDLCQLNCTGTGKSSDYGYGLDLLAPADDIPAITSNGGCGVFGGNSGAVPHVCGSLGLLRSYLGSAYYPEDLEWLLKLTALDVGIHTDGDEETREDWNGHGNLKVGAALALVADQSMIVESYFQTGGVVVDSLYSNPVPYTFLKGQWLGTYDAQVYKVNATVTYLDSFVDVPKVWGLSHEISGISAANPSYSAKYCSVVEETQEIDGCVLYTYLMKVKLFANMPPVWYPCSPSNVVVRCRVIGEPTSKKGIQGEVYHTNDVMLVASPNPLNGGASISCNATVRGSNNLEIFSLRGNRVAVLFATNNEGGTLRWDWDGLSRDGGHVGSGTYLARTTVNGLPHSI